MNTLSFFNPRFTSDLFDVIDRNFSDLGYSYPEKTMVPKVDVREMKDKYVLEMELPGCTENDVAIDLKDRVLSIASKKEENAKEDKKENKENKEETSWLIKERVSTKFSRSFTLPEDIDADNVSANFKNGLLTIDIPRKAETKARRIAICA